MTSFVALLRGINVGGRNSLPMPALREELSDLGCENVKSYIQSGNVVFELAGEVSKLGAKLTESIDVRFGFRPQVMIVSANEFDNVVAANPFMVDDVEPKALHVWFLSGKVEASSVDRMRSLAANGEKFELEKKAFYLYAPNGVGRSKLASNVEKCLGVPATARNWRTVGKISELLDELR